MLTGTVAGIYPLGGGLVELLLNQQFPNEDRTVGDGSDGAPVPIWLLSNISQWAMANIKCGQYVAVNCEIRANNSRMIRVLGLRVEIPPVLVNRKKNEK